MKHITEDHLPFLITAAQLLQAADRAPNDLRRDLVQRAKDCLGAVDAAVDAAEPEEFPLRHYQSRFTEEALQAARTDDDAGVGPVGTVIQADAPAGANGPSEPSATDFAS